MNSSWSIIFIFFGKQMFMGMILRARNFNYDNFCTLLFLEPYAYFSQYWKWLESSRIIRKLTLSQMWITRGPICMLASDLCPKMSLGDTANFVWCNIALLSFLLDNVFLLFSFYHFTVNLPVIFYLIFLLYMACKCMCEFLNSGLISLCHHTHYWWHQRHVPTN